LRRGQAEEGEQAVASLLKAQDGRTAQAPLAQKCPAGAYQADVAGTLNNLGVLYGDTGRLADAEKAYSEAPAIRRLLSQSSA
jgi:hypothetical protein